MVDCTAVSIAEAKATAPGERMGCKSRKLAAGACRSGLGAGDWLVARGHAAGQRDG